MWGLEIGFSLHYAAKKKKKQVEILSPEVNIKLVKKKKKRHLI